MTPCIILALCAASPQTQAEAFLTRVVCTWKYADALRFFMRNGRNRESAEFILGVERVNRCSEGK